MSRGRPDLNAMSDHSDRTALSAAADQSSSATASGPADVWSYNPDKQIIVGQSRLNARLGRSGVEFSIADDLCARLSGWTRGEVETASEFPYSPDLHQLRLSFAHSHLPIRDEITATDLKTCASAAKAHGLDVVSETTIAGEEQLVRFVEGAYHKISSRPVRVAYRLSKSLSISDSSGHRKSVHATSCTDASSGGTCLSNNVEQSRSGRDNAYPEIAGAGLSTLNDSVIPLVTRGASRWNESLEKHENRVKTLSFNAADYLAKHDTKTAAVLGNYLVPSITVPHERVKDLAQGATRDIVTLQWRPGSAPHFVPRDSCSNEDIDRCRTTMTALGFADVPCSRIELSAHRDQLRQFTESQSHPPIPVQTTYTFGKDEQRLEFKDWWLTPSECRVGFQGSLDRQDGTSHYDVFPVLPLKIKPSYSDAELRSLISEFHESFYLPLGSEAGSRNLATFSVVRQGDACLKAAREHGFTAIDSVEIADAATVLELLNERSTRWRCVPITVTFSLAKGGPIEGSWELGKEE